MAPRGDAISSKLYRAKDFCFTSYEKDPPCGDHHSVTYLVYQREAGNKKHREHWQGYAEFLHAKSYTSVQKCLKIGKAHVEKRKGQRSEAADYCMKDDTRLEGTTWTEQGVRQDDDKQGQRNDLQNVADMIQDKKRVRAVAFAHPVEYIKYHKGIEKLRLFQIEPRNEACEITVLYGGTGVGKSRKARELLPDAYIWGPEQGKWFDAYDGEDECIFEEFRGQLPFGMLLRLLDRYDCRVEVKGGTIQFRATKIILTSPIHPKEWYKNFENDHDKIDQLLRRITTIEHLTPANDS